MITKATTANGAAKRDARYLALMDRDLAEIKAIQKDIVQRRTQGRKVTARIDRNLKAIQAIIDRVQATV